MSNRITMAALATILGSIPPGVGARPDANV